MKRYWSKECGPPYFITNTVVEWKNVFIFKPYIRIILDSWQHFQTNRDILFYGFIIMPSHLHYIVQPTNQSYGLIEMQRDFKKFTAKRILDGLNYEVENGAFPVLDTFEHKNLHREPACELLNFFKMVGKYSRQAHKIWMPEENPIEIHTPEFMRRKLEYIHFNPVKAHIVPKPEDYPFSSARNFYLDDESIFEVVKIMTS